MRESTVPKHRVLPRERSQVIVKGDDQAIVIHDADTSGERSTARLELERDRIKAETVAPDGCCIETGPVKGRKFR